MATSDITSGTLSISRVPTGTSSSTVALGNHTHSAATTYAAGFMSAADKAKLDGIATGANKYVHPSYTSKTSGLYKVTVDSTGHVSAATAVTKADITALGIPGQDTNTTYSNMTGATTSAAGKSGLVPAPSTGAANRYLRSDGTWAVPPDTNTTYSDMKGATADTAGTHGLVPAPAAGAQAKFLRGDGTWVVPTNTDTKATQTNTTTNADYRVVLSTNANDTTETNTLRKSVNFQANPSTGAFYAKGYDIIDLTGKTQDLDDLTLSSGSPMKMLYIEKTNGGAANITNSPVEDTPFLLEVELLRWASTTDYITLQTFRCTDFLANGDYVRACVSGTWREWTRRPNTYSLSSFGITATAAELNKLDGVTATAKELNYVDGVTSNIQTQLNGKLPTTGTAAKATADARGQNIADTYIKGLSVSGRTITYTKGDGGTGTITTQDTTYTHPNSGVTAGTYKSVTVNAQGHVTAGSNPTTLAGYGITDACKIVYQTSEPTSGLIKNMVWIG